jgi:hypothetical protein
MTEAEWLSCADPTPMLEFLQRKVSDRKVQLFVVSCLGRLWHLLDERSRRAVEAVEAYAEGRIAEEQLFQARQEAFHGLMYIVPEGDGERILQDIASNITLVGGLSNATGFLLSGLREFPSCVAPDTLRDVIGPLLFRSISSKPGWLAWNDSTVVKIAQAIYDERAFDRMPILADTLADANCDNTEFLGHCREPGTHVRGCWLIDLLTGRE